MTRNKVEIFVFGSNKAGRHGRGAAKFALQHYGAKYGQGEGLQGRSYAIPTKDGKLVPLSLSEIKQAVDRFIKFAERSLEHHPEFHFSVTAIGTGLAGHKHEDIAPMFAEAPKNCTLPESWRTLLAK